MININWLTRYTCFRNHRGWVRSNNKITWIIDLESAIGKAEVIDVKSVEGDNIKFGATVEIEDDESGEKQQYQIVGEYESDIENKKLSITSPLARGLIGKTKEDNVEINSPKGLKSYTILSIKYIWI